MISCPRPWVASRHPTPPRAAVGRRARRRHRGWAGLLVAGVVLSACADGGDAGPTADAGACGEVEQVPDQGHQHLVGDAEPPTEYNSTPPTSGWHLRGRGPALVGIHDTPLEEPEHVSVLEVDGVVVSYAGLDDAERDELADIVAGTGAAVALTPYDGLDDGQVAMTAWSRKQVCEGVDRAAVEAFVDEHAAEEATVHDEEG